MSPLINMSQLIVIEDQLSPEVLSTPELNTLVETLELYAKDINNSPWVEHSYIEKPIEVKLLPKTASNKNIFPKGAYNLILLDEISLEGILGYHEDEDDGKIPVSYVPIKEIREDGATISEVATHELGEMAINPFVSQESEIRTITHDNLEYIVEIADPLQEYSYRLSNGELAANFVWPSWFNLPQIRRSLVQYKGYLLQEPFIKNPFEIGKYGYISTKEPGQEWKQIFGERRDKLPKWASRLPRIHGNIK